MTYEQRTADMRDRNQDGVKAKVNNERDFSVMILPSNQIFATRTGRQSPWLVKEHYFRLFYKFSVWLVSPFKLKLHIFLDKSIQHNFKLFIQSSVSCGKARTIYGKDMILLYDKI